MRRCSRSILGVALVTSFWAGRAAPVAPAAESPGGATRDLVQLGRVTVDAKARTVTVPAELNMGCGPVEYLLVERSGKTHESLLVTDVQPAQIHAAMLLLGLGRTRADEPPPDVPPAIDAEFLKRAPRPRGASVSVTLRWTHNDRARTGPASELIRTERAGVRMPGDAWVYTGSFFGRRGFAAQEEGSVAALLNDPGALLSADLSAELAEQEWWVDESRVPPVGAPVFVTIALRGGLAIR